MLDIENYSEEIFEKIKHITKDGIEFWYARQLQTVLEYAEWRNFNKVIDKAKIACKHSKHKVSPDFVDVNKIVDLGADMQRSIQDIMLSRYGCYLIVQNADPRKKVVALGQTIKELGGEMPENLPTPKKSVKQIEKEHKKKELPRD